MRMSLLGHNDGSINFGRKRERQVWQAVSDGSEIAELGISMLYSMERVRFLSRIFRRVEVSLVKQIDQAFQSASIQYQQCYDITRSVWAEEDVDFYRSLQQDIHSPLLSIVTFAVRDLVAKGFVQGRTSFQLLPNKQMNKQYELRATRSIL